MTDKPNEERVGYGHPPREHRFKPGTSGNPRGRPKGARGLKTLVQELLDETVPVTVAGKRSRISKLKAALERMAQRALVDGDMRAIEKMLHYAERYDQEAVIQDAGLEPDDEALIARHVHRLRATGAADGK